MKRYEENLKDYNFNNSTTEIPSVLSGVQTLAETRSTDKLAESGHQTQLHFLYTVEKTAAVRLSFACLHMLTSRDRKTEKQLITDA